MQVKKEEIRNALLEKAEIEFYDKGFEKASIRSIVKAAGTTIGNFYNYFQNKEALFDELVKVEYATFIHFMKHHHELQKPDYLWDIADPIEWRKALPQLIDSIAPLFSNKLVLLIECSKGTKYETTRATLIELTKENFREHMEKYNPNFIDLGISEVIAEQFINGIMVVLRKYDGDTRNSLLTELILFYFIGAMGLLSDFK